MIRPLLRVWRFVAFGAFFAWEVVLASLRVIHDIVTPRHYMRPGVVAIRLDAESDAEITWLANLITLTPGSIALDVSDDRRVLYVHAAFLDDRDALEREVKQILEKRLLELTR